ncbi:MAG: hypothetical protein J7551_10995 [Chloroflexi bacterium]|jgi:hypothetical protein|nr:hypothetical protein [Chloroflexota bacterium]
MMNIDKGFMELVQLHEREWGTELYPDRPSLAELLSAPIVAMWTSDAARYPVPAERSKVRQVQVSIPEVNPAKRFMLSVHQSLEELDPLLLAMVVAGKAAPTANRKLLRLFIGQKPVKILGVRLLLEPLP